MTGVLESVSYRAPLALRVVDAASSAAVADDLVAVAWPEGDPAAGRPARRSSFSSLLQFPSLPGLRDQEHVVTPGDVLPVWPPLVPRPFVVSVADRARRFGPQVLRLTVPQAAPVDVTLYSSPARRTPSGWGTVSGEVHTAAAPAAWAWVEISDGTGVYPTVADELGRYVVYLPYPDALPPLAGSPPAGSGLTALSWPLTCTVRYRPQDQVRPSTTGPPDIASVRSQAAAAIRTDAGPRPSTEATLHFAVPLRLALSVVPA